MELRLFTDLIDAPGKAAGVLKIVNLPIARTRLDNPDAAYRRIDTYLLRPYIRIQRRRQRRQYGLLMTNIIARESI